jgi:hypothetical protein
MSKPTMDDPAVAALVEKQVKKAVKEVKAVALEAVKLATGMVLEFDLNKAVKKDIKEVFKSAADTIKAAA